MVGWHHPLNGWMDSGSWDGRGGLACCSPWGHKESDTTEQLNRTEFFIFNFSASFLPPNTSDHHQDTNQVVENGTSTRVTVLGK